MAGGAASTSARGDVRECYLGTTVPIVRGDRVLVKGHGPGVVKYVGPLSDDFITDEYYVGVKLDSPDPSRHDGVVRGKRYFTCTPGHGILVKARNVTLVHKGLMAESSRSPTSHGDAKHALGAHDPHRPNRSRAL